jgi:non-canonical poly(A) RNA polymerase PAPD5/7
LSSKQDQVTSFAYKNDDRLSVIDPKNPANDISGGSRNYYFIYNAFSSAHNVLQTRMQEFARIPPHKRGKLSILEAILGADYSSFSDQRADLRNFHVDRFGSCNTGFADTTPAG